MGGVRGGGVRGGGSDGWVVNTVKLYVKLYHIAGV